jgi:hypothetical protein
VTPYILVKCIDVSLAELSMKRNVIVLGYSSILKGGGSVNIVWTIGSQMVLRFSALRADRSLHGSIIWYPFLLEAQ